MKAQNVSAETQQSKYELSKFPTHLEKVEQRLQRMSSLCFCVLNGEGISILEGHFTNYKLVVM